MHGHRLLAVNHKLVRLLGFDWEELLSKRIEDLMPLSELPRLNKSLKHEPTAETVDTRYVHKDGTTLFVKIYYRDNWYLDSNKKERPIRLVVVTKAGVSNLHELEMPQTPYATPSESQLRRVAWLKKLAISS